MCTYSSDFEVQHDGLQRNLLSAECSSEIILRDTQSLSGSTDPGNYLQSGDERRRAENQKYSESDSGIDWKFANQGINLLSLSVEESATISRNPSCGNVSFARQLYLHGLTYLLRGLPSDLSPEEEQSIQGSIPRKLLNHGDSDARDGLTTPPPAKSHATSFSSQPSILRKALATTIVHVFVFFQFLLPYLKFLLRSAYEYERTHHISEKVLASSVDIADAFGKQSLAISAALYGMKNGKVGEVLSEVASWLIESIAGGIQDGIGEGLNVVALKK